MLFLKEVCPDAYNPDTDETIYKERVQSSAPARSVAPVAPEPKPLPINMRPMSNSEYDTKLNFLREQYELKANIDRAISAAIAAKNYLKAKEFSASRAVYQRNITDMAQDIFYETFRRKNSGANTF